MQTSPRAPGYARSLWHRWKALRLPWRRRFLVGVDLAGNTFWEFKDALQSNRWRRIVKYSRTTHYADVKITPQWYQWLRHTREDAPTIEEQQHDISRQAMLKQLAARADERWKSVPSFRDPPKLQQPVPAIGVNDSGGYSAPELQLRHEESTTDAATDAVTDAVASQAGEVPKSRHLDAATKRQTREKKLEQSPWKTPQKGAPSENWQPESWTPGALQRR